MYYINRHCPDCGRVDCSKHIEILKRVMKALEGLYDNKELDPYDYYSWPPKPQNKPCSEKVKPEEGVQK